MKKDQWKNKVICMKTLADRNVSKLRNRDETKWMKKVKQNKNSNLKPKINTAKWKWNEKIQTLKMIHKWNEIREKSKIGLMDLR